MKKEKGKEAIEDRGLRLLACMSLVFVMACSCYAQNTNVKQLEKQLGSAKTDYEAVKKMKNSNKPISSSSAKLSASNKIKKIEQQLNATKEKAKSTEKHVAKKTVYSTPPEVQNNIFLKDDKGSVISLYMGSFQMPSFQGGYYTAYSITLGPFYYETGMLRASCTMYQDYFEFCGVPSVSLKNVYIRVARDLSWAEGPTPTQGRGGTLYHIPATKAEYDTFAHDYHSTPTLIPYNTTPSINSPEASGNSIGSSNTCTQCGGSGLCGTCGSSKGSYKDVGYYTGHTIMEWINCSMCFGSGKCFMCRGSGKFN